MSRPLPSPSRRSLLTGLLAAGAAPGFIPLRRHPLPAERIAVQRGRKLRWDPRAERFAGDDGANALLQPRPFRGEWKLPAV